MSVTSAPYFWVVCDEPGCRASCPSGGDEVAAWEDEEQARMYAEESEWHLTDDGQDLCPEHVTTAEDD